MDKPPPLMAGSLALLTDEFGTRTGSSAAEFRAALKPLFLWMHKHRVERVEIVREGTKAQTFVELEK